MSDPILVESSVVPAKRVRRTAEEKRLIVEATLVAGASIARVAREHGVNANQVFQWRHEYRKGTLGRSQQVKPKLMPVSLAVEPSSVLPLDRGTSPSRSAAIHIDLPGKATIRIEAGVDLELVRTVLGSLSR